MFCCERTTEASESKTPSGTLRSRLRSHHSETASASYDTYQNGMSTHVYDRCHVRMTKRRTRFSDNVLQLVQRNLIVLNEFAQYLDCQVGITERSPILKLGYRHSGNLIRYKKTTIVRQSLHDHRTKIQMRLSPTRAAVCDRRGGGCHDDSREGRGFCVASLAVLQRYRRGFRRVSPDLLFPSVLNGSPSSSTGWALGRNGGEGVKDSCEKKQETYVVGFDGTNFGAQTRE